MLYKDEANLPEFVIMHTYMRNNNGTFTQLVHKYEIESRLGELHVEIYDMYNHEILATTHTHF